MSSATDHSFIRLATGLGSRFTDAAGALLRSLGMAEPNGVIHLLADHFNGAGPGETRIIPIPGRSQQGCLEALWTGGSRSDPSSYWLRDAGPMEEARDRLALIEALVEHSYEGISMFDARANILYEHPANQRITGYPAEEMIGRNLFEFCHPEDAERLVPRFERLAQRPGEADSDIVRWRRRDGEWIYLEGTVVNQLQHPRLRGMINTFREVTHRIEMERQLKTAHLQEKENRELQQRFLANLSHELRTPLTLVKQPVEELTADSNDLRADIARRNLRRLESLAEELIDLTRMDAGVFELRARRHSVDELLHGWMLEVEPLAAERGMELRLLPGDRDLQVYADERKLAKAVLNLLGNAIKFGPAGSTVEVRFQRHEAGNDTVSSRLRIEVEDQGEPIPEGVRGSMFERFFQGHDGREQEQGMGLGLGLAVAREMVELHGGEIGAERRPNGNCFWIELPLEADHLAPHEIDLTPQKDLPLPERLELLPASQELPASPEARSLGNASKDRRPLIFMVEDNPDLSNYLAFHLERLYTLETAVTAEDALRRILAKPPSLLLSDVMLPGMDGLALVSRLREHFSPERLPMILLSAKGTHHDRVAGLAAGADDYLAKPFSMQELLLRIHRLLGGRSKSSATEITGWAEKLNELVAERIGDPGFGVAQLAESMGMSPRQLQRRFGEVMGIRPVEFLRQRRLEHGADLLESGKVESVAEAAGRIGMTPAYFSRLFAATYGMPPSQVLARQRQDA